ncbi:MAG: signal recognition particle protein Srp19 [Nitrososphaerota archaeon]|jgi:signal recognition particle subunit SRP19|nr:signal recognition particle protein Srp19 [Nitrososphaerota archaeon]
MRKLNGKAIIWPVYFDQNRSRKEGRRIAKDQAVLSPKVVEIKEAADRLGLKNEINIEAHYPKMPWAKIGMLIVEKHEAKETIIKKLSKQLIKIKNQQASEQPAKRK